MAPTQFLCPKFQSSRAETEDSLTLEQPFLPGICLDLISTTTPYHPADKTADARGLWKLKKPASSYALRLCRPQLVDRRAHPLPLTTNLRVLAARMAQGGALNPGAMLVGQVGPVGPVDPARSPASSFHICSSRATPSNELSR